MVMTSDWNQAYRLDTNDLYNSKFLNVCIQMLLEKNVTYWMSLIIIGIILSFYQLPVSSSVAGITFNGCLLNRYGHGKLTIIASFLDIFQV